MLLSFRIGFFVRKSDLFDLPSPKLSILILFAEWDVPEFNFQSILQRFGLIVFRRYENFILYLFSSKG